MTKFTYKNRLPLGQLSEEKINEVHENALHILENTGVFFHSIETVEFLVSKGATANLDTHIVCFPREMVLDAIEKTPSSFDLFDADGNALHIGGDETHFAPGSCGVRMLDPDGSHHESRGLDLANIARVAENLDNIEMLSTALTPHEVPENLGDSYRVLTLLKNTKKTFVSGAFSKQGLFDIHEMLAAACGGQENLRKKPRAVLDVCSFSPLKWTETSCHNLMDGAKLDIPLEILSVPMIGATSPATLYGCVLMHTVELLSGLVVVQNVNPGNRVVYGGAPMYFDMRTTITSLDSIETTLISAAYGQMGKFYGIPTHTYSCLSDSKSPDAQAGLESGMSALMAVSSGFNIVSGAGMLEFCDMFSLEKMVIDNDICGMAKRAAKGILCNDDTLAADLIMDMGSDGDYLASKHTMKWFRKESYMPSPVIDRTNLAIWEADGSKTAEKHAEPIVEQELEKDNPIPQEICDAVDKVWDKLNNR